MTDRPEDDRSPAPPPPGARRGSPGSGSASIIIPVRSTREEEARRQRRRWALGGLGVAIVLAGGALTMTRLRRAPAAKVPPASTSSAAVAPAPRESTTAVAAASPESTATVAPVSSPPVATAPRESTTAPTPSPTVAAPAPPARRPATAAEARAGVAAVVAAYAAAISAGDADAIARVYPALSEDDRGAWRGFFAGVSGMRARLTPRDVRVVEPNRATAAVSGTYAYVTGTPPKPVRKAVGFEGTFVRDSAGAWLLETIR